MPDLSQWLVFGALALLAGGAVAWPLFHAQAADPQPDREGSALRHRISLEALLDVEADRRAGSLDDASYERERSEAETRAALTLAQVDAPPQVSTPAAARGDGRRAAAWLGAALAGALLVGFALPEPLSLAPRTVMNQPLADALAREAERQAEIQRLLAAFEADPRDPGVLSDLADAYLAGSSADDLQRGAVALQLLIAVDPENRSAYRRLITAYITAGDWTDAQAATDSYAIIAGPQEADIPFFRGLIAFRQGENAAAVRLFDEFLRLAPDDDRVSMVAGLRADAAGRLPGASPSPGS